MDKKINIQANENNQETGDTILISYAMSNIHFQLN